MCRYRDARDDEAALPGRRPIAHPESGQSLAHPQAVLLHPHNPSREEGETAGLRRNRPRRPPGVLLCPPEPRRPPPGEKRQAIPPARWRLAGPGLHRRE